MTKIRFKYHHGGILRTVPKVEYIGGQVIISPEIDPDFFDYWFMYVLPKDCGVSMEIKDLYYVNELGGLKRLEPSDVSIIELSSTALKMGLLDMFCVGPEGIVNSGPQMVGRPKLTPRRNSGPTMPTMSPTRISPSRRSPRLNQSTTETGSGTAKTAAPQTTKTPTHPSTAAKTTGKSTQSPKPSSVAAQTTIPHSPQTPKTSSAAATSTAANRKPAAHSKANTNPTSTPPRRSPRNLKATTEVVATSQKQTETVTETPSPHTIEPGQPSSTRSLRRNLKGTTKPAAKPSKPALEEEEGDSESDSGDDSEDVTYDIEDEAEDEDNIEEELSCSDSDTSDEEWQQTRKIVDDWNLRRKADFNHLLNIVQTGKLLEPREARDPDPEKDKDKEGEYLSEYENSDSDILTPGESEEDDIRGKKRKRRGRNRSTGQQRQQTSTRRRMPVGYGILLRPDGTPFTNVPVQNLGSGSQTQTSLSTGLSPNPSQSTQASNAP